MVSYPSLANFYEMSYHNWNNLTISYHNWNNLKKFITKKLNHRHISKRRPIIFVHGLTNVAGTYEYIRRYFLTKGYNNSELYATTYSYGVKKFLKDKMECRHITQVNLIN